MLQIKLLYIKKKKNLSNNESDNFDHNIDNYIFANTPMRVIYIGSPKMVNEPFFKSWKLIGYKNTYRK